MSWPARGGERPVLAPAGHAAVDELRIALQQRLGAEAEALHHAGAKALDDRVGAARPVRSAAAAPAVDLEVERHRAAAAHHHVVPALVAEAEVAVARPVDEQHVGAHVGQHHAANGPGPIASNSSTRRPASGPAEGLREGSAATPRAKDRARRYMLRRYWPPTSNSASVIWPSEQTRTASISTSNTLPLAMTVSLQALQHGRRLRRVAGMEVGEPLQLALLFFLGRALQLDVLGHRRRRAGCGRC